MFNNDDDMWAGAAVVSPPLSQLAPRSIFLYGLPNDLPRHVQRKLKGAHPNSSRPGLAFVKDLMSFIWLPVGVQLVFIFYLAREVMTCQRGDPGDTPWFLIMTAILVHWFHCFGPLPLGVRALMFVHDADGGPHEMTEGAVYEDSDDEAEKEPANSDVDFLAQLATATSSRNLAAASGRDGLGFVYHELREAATKNKVLPGMRAVHDEVQTIEITVEGSHRPGGCHEWYVPVIASALIIFDKFLMPLLIVFIGGLFLCTSNTAGELVMNSAAVVCINEVDDMIMIGGSYTSNLVWEVNLPLLPGWFRKWYSKLCREWAIVPVGMASLTCLIGRFALDL